MEGFGSFKKLGFQDNQINVKEPFCYYLFTRSNEVLAVKEEHEVVEA